MFYVLNVTENQLVLNESGEPLPFVSGKHAQEWCIMVSAKTGMKYQPRRATLDLNWRTRENDKYNTGEYKFPAWFDYYDLKRITDHFVHVSLKDPSKIAFTQSEEKGQADIQTPMRVGAYLTQYFPHLHGETIKEIIGQHSMLYAPKSLKWAHTADEIEHVYINGPRSCMSKKDHEFNSHCHPVRVYGDTELSVAYLVSDDGIGISARALCWQAKKIYVRIYGDESRLKPLLNDLGYERGELYGAKVNAIVCENTGDYIMPYLDGPQRADLIDGKMVLNDDGEYSCDQTNGLASEENRIECEECGDSVRDDETREVYYLRHSTRTWCESCRDHHAFYCDGIGEMVADSAALMVNGEMYSEWYVRDNFEYCEGTDEWHSGENIVVTVSIHNVLATRQWSEEYAQENAFVCRISGDWFENDLATYDNWADEPRASHIVPNDIPADTIAA